MTDALHKPYWSVAIYADEIKTSPRFECEREARSAFRNPALFVEEPLPESYAVVLWECQESGLQSALTSQVVSLPAPQHEVWSGSY